MDIGKEKRKWRSEPLVEPDPHRESPPAPEPLRSPEKRPEGAPEKV